MTRDESWDEMMSDLRQEYLKQLTERIKMLETLTQDVRWDRLYDEYHKLKGTGRTYGYDEITVVCQKLEDFCKARKVKAQTTASPAELDTLKSGLQLMNHLLSCYTQEKPVDLGPHPAYQLLCANT